MGKPTRRFFRNLSKYAPHYISATICLIIALTSTIVLSAIILNKLNILPFQNFQVPEQQENQISNQDEKLPSQYHIGKPYKKAIKDKSKPLVVEFYADWCPHCKRMTPVFEKVSKKIKNVNFSTINSQVEENADLNQKYNVDRYPFIIIIDTKNGTHEVLEITGESFDPKALEQQIKQKISR